MITSAGALDRLYDYGLAGVLIAVFVLFVGALVKFVHSLLGKLIADYREDLAYHRAESAAAREAFLEQLRERTEAGRLIARSLEEDWKKRHGELLDRLDRIERAVRQNGKGA